MTTLDIWYFLNLIRMQFLSCVHFFRNLWIEAFILISVSDVDGFAGGRHEACDPCIDWKSSLTT